jgi:hypothetical protein
VEDKHRGKGILARRKIRGGGVCVVNESEREREVEKKKKKNQ